MPFRDELRQLLDVSLCFQPGQCTDLNLGHIINKQDDKLAPSSTKSLPKPMLTEVADAN